MADKTAIIKDAQKFLARGQVDKAIAEWEKIIKDGPDANVHNIIGDLYLKKGDKKSAIKSFHSAADVFRQDGFSLKALALYKKVLNINPSESWALFALGQLNEEKGLNTDAIKYYLASADSFSKEGEKSRLQEIYEKVVSLSPSNIPLRIKIAEIFMKDGIKAAAAKEYYEIARICQEKGDFEAGRENYLKVLDIQPKHKEAIIGLGELLNKIGGATAAEEHMRQAAILFHEDADVLFRYAELASSSGHTEAAKGCLTKIRSIDPENRAASELLGEVYLKEGATARAWEEYLPVIDADIRDKKYDKAVKLIGPFRAIEPFETSKRLISIYRETGENEAAADEMIVLAEAFNEKGMDDEALALYRDALELRPEDDRIKDMIGRLDKKPEDQTVAEQAPGTEKTPEEIITEADIFLRYGLPAEALTLLEGLKVREPANIDLHIKLKSIYVEMMDKELAVAECMILNELYKGLGNEPAAERIMNEAMEINPDDPRLVGRGISRSPESTFTENFDMEFSEEFGKKPDIDDYAEEIAEADFYKKQGMIAEAAEILQKLKRLFPDSSEISERLEKLDSFEQTSSVPCSCEFPENLEKSTTATEPGPSRGPELSESPELSQTSEAFGESEFRDRPEFGNEPESSAADLQTRKEGPEQTSPEATSPEEVKPPEITGYEDLFSSFDLDEDAGMPEPALDDNVREIFDEFKKGLEKELSDEDSETHYNLGIAFKEMGLTDDAIKEFQISRNDPARLVQSCTMLGICYMEKGLYSLAIDTLTNVIKEVDEKDDSYWPLVFDLADAYDRNNNLKEALDLFTRVYGWDAGFRKVDERISDIKRRLGKDPEQTKPAPKKDRVSYL